MNIRIVSGIGTGPTKLAAFDAALNAAGIANYNLIRLSSVIPADSKIAVYHTQLASTELPGKWGDRLYVVMADARLDEPGLNAWAGIGWAQDKATGRGLFVEHEGNSENAVRGDIEQSLGALMRTRGVDFGEANFQVIGTSCKDEAVCALVVAVYQVSDWHNKAQFLEN